MNIVASSNIGLNESIYTVEIANNRYVDVKIKTYFAYIMQNEDGSLVFDEDGNCYNYAINENEIVRYVVNTLEDKTGYIVRYTTMDKDKTFYKEEEEFSSKIEAENFIVKLKCGVMDKEIIDAYLISTEKVL